RAMADELYRTVRHEGWDRTPCGLGSRTSSSAGGKPHATAGDAPGESLAKVQLTPLRRRYGAPTSPPLSKCYGFRGSPRSRAGLGPAVVQKPKGAPRSRQVMTMRLAFERPLSAFLFSPTRPSLYIPLRFTPAP